MEEMHGGDVLAAGTRLEEFEIERKLGAGGFGVTYLAHDLKLDRQVAIKEYLPYDWATRLPNGVVGPRSAKHVEDYRWGLDRFRGEAQVLARLRTPRVVQVHRVIETRGTAYMVMEYVKGQSLAEALLAEGPWREAQVLALLDALTDGLTQVHAADLAHRDIKPSNVMLRGDDGSPVLIDFGAARQVVGRQSRSKVTVMWTDGYSPYEQYSTERSRQGAWTDVYALGAVAYEALSGRVPVNAPARMKHDTLQPVAEVAVHGVSLRFAAAIMSALELHGQDRPQNLAKWRVDLGLPAAGRVAGPGGASRWRLAGAAAVVVALAGAGLAWLAWDDEPPEPVEAVAGAPDGENARGVERGDRGGAGGSGVSGAPPADPPPPAAREAAERTGADSEPGADAQGSAREDPAPAVPPEAWPPGHVFRDCDACPQMVVIPAGTFQMGSPASERGRYDWEDPRHEVTLNSSFAMGVTEVTFDEWEACVRGGGCNGYRPDDRDWGRGVRPVINVNWVDAQAYVSWLSAETKAVYRLPSESEWEYAARAGTTTPFHTGATISRDQANYSADRSVPVGTFEPNAFGLYDVHGNVWEWVEDCWYATYAGAPADGSAWTVGRECSPRVLRGGSWVFAQRFARSAARFRLVPGYRGESAGIRVSRTLD